MYNFHGCLTSSFSKPDNYCEAIRQLLEEHPSLTKEMDRFRETAAMLAYSPQREDRDELAGQLCMQIENFHKKIFLHAEKEEYLFDFVTKYVGNGSSPLTVMENERLKVKESLDKFFTKYSEGPGFTPEDVRELAYIAAGIFHTLTDHFLKEEEILFPFAEGLLKDEEKLALLQKFHHSTAI
ncbi:hemerythrin domain-containing protein [Evansella clarkii]|jgi:hemerythrin-like domain-containing protein|uniref:hemerythrin domain-containing protein n=1 Tax=Evansella clarkii TaxID=79879 RepID=UPI000998282A|nr:hemerythrin domain-containing protein [Evansella clarkii]